VGGGGGVVLLAVVVVVGRAVVVVVLLNKVIFIISIIFILVLKLNSCLKKIHESLVVLLHIYRAQIRCVDRNSSSRD
jgi:hypothetical protein